MLVPICQLRLHVNHFRRGKYRGTWRCLFTHKWSSKCWPCGIKIGFQRELPCHSFSPYNIFKFNKMPTNDRHLFLLICLADRFIPPPDHIGSGVVCLDQRGKYPHSQTAVCYNTATTMSKRLFCCRFYLSPGAFKSIWVSGFGPITV